MIKQFCDACEKEGIAATLVLTMTGDEDMANTPDAFYGDLCLECWQKIADALKPLTHERMMSAAHFMRWNTMGE